MKKELTSRYILTVCGYLLIIPKIFFYYCACILYAIIDEKFRGQFLIHTFCFCEQAEISYEKVVKQMKGETDADE